MDELSELRSENAGLRAQLLSLEKKLAFLGRHQTLARGISGEKLISRLIGGSLTVHTAPADLVLANGTRTEIKQSTFAPSSKGFTGGRRWNWHKVLGETNSKEYDFLVLIGDADPAFAHLYDDPISPYVMFCIPKEEVYYLTTKGTRGARGIMLLTNPKTVRAASSRPLYAQYQITVENFIKRFGVLA